MAINGQEIVSLIKRQVTVSPVFKDCKVLDLTNFLILEKISWV